MAVKPKNDGDGELMRHVPSWLRNPATVDMPKDVKDFVARANVYFEECIIGDERPTITGLALAVGLPGPTSLIRLGQRLPDLRYSISRCITAVAKGYEDLIGHGNAAGPMFMLKNLPDFDPDEPNGAPPVQFFNERKEVLLTAHVAGAATEGMDYNEDPVEAYVNILKATGRVIEDQQGTATFATKPTPRETRAYRPVLRIISEPAEDPVDE